jgi:uncharacterized repeat protein (TIGR01451 family)/fimbrial isopeptide formation D2 family protein
VNPVSFSVKSVQVRSMKHSKNHLLAASITILSSILGLASSAHAEGSKDLYPSGATGSRANIEWRVVGEGLYGGKLIRRSLFKVYAKAGETILLGSSAVGVKDGATTGDILLYNPGLVSGTIGSESFPLSPALSCDIQAKGFINTRDKELAGPTTSLAPTIGYVPCTYTAPSTGIYDVVFTGPFGFDPPSTINLNGNVTGSILDAPNNFNKEQKTSISSWDVTVRTDPTDATTNQNGRLFTYYLTAFTADNGRPINSIVYPVTTDGYLYETAFNGLDPNGFVAFGNRSGFLNSDGTPLYRDALGAGGAGNQGLIPTIQGGVTMALPEFPIFFNRTPNSEVLTTLNIPTSATLPTLSNFLFTGTTATAFTSTENTGGTFKFDTQNNIGSYELVISNDGVDFDPTNPLNRSILRQIGGSGTQTVVWDGKRNDGSFFPVSTTARPNYPVQATLRAGEYHFPLLDAENSTRGGPSLTLLNAVRPLGPSTAFYDDRGYKTANGTLVGTAVNGSLCAISNGGLVPTPLFSDPINGYDSTKSARNYGLSSGGNDTSSSACTSIGSFGDKKGLDLWTYFPSVAQLGKVIIIPSTVPKANAIKYVELIADTDGSGSLTGGDKIRYTIVYNNSGTAAAAGFQITDTLPTDVTFVPKSLTVVGAGTETIAVANANPSYNGTTAAPNLLATGAVLGINGTITVTIEATIKGTAMGDIFNRANGTSTSPGYPTGGILTDTRDRATPGIPTSSVDQSIYYPAIRTGSDPTGITVVSPKPVLNKSVKRLRDNDRSGTLTPGDDVQYTIVLRNPNPVAQIQNVVVSDAIPTQLKFLTGNADPVTVMGSPFVRATTLPTVDFNGDGRTPIALTNSATLAPGASITVTFNARILPGAASPIANQALVNFQGDLGKPIRSDASDSANPTAPGSGVNPGNPNANGDVTQPNIATDDETILNLVSPVNPVGTKAVRLVDDKDGSGSVSVGDVVEYTVIYRNTSNTAVNNFQITDSIDTTKLTFVPNSYTFTKSDPTTTVPAQSIYNGGTDTLMTGKGDLAANSSVTITFRATIIASAPANTVISNQASATSSGLTTPSLTDALSGPKDEPQTVGNTATDPTLLTVKEPGDARLKLVKRITGATRNGVTIAGLNFDQYIEESPDTADIKTAGLTPFGLLEVSALTPLRSGDEAEYTVYFLSDGKSFAQNVALCDLVPTGTTFVPNSFGSQQGITLRINNATTSQTNVTDADRGSFFPSLTPLPAPNGCSNSTNPNGAAIVQLGTLTNLSPGNVGFFRFRVRIN